jgi:hypothetical protein
MQWSQLKKRIFERFAQSVKEKDIIGRWALQAGLEVARYM